MYAKPYQSSPTTQRILGTLRSLADRDANKARAAAVEAQKKKAAAEKAEPVKRKGGWPKGKPRGPRKAA